MQVPTASLSSRRLLGLVSLLIPLILCQSDAFHGQSRFLGRALRGGSSTAAQQQNQNEKDQQQQLTCVMQMPPRTRNGVSPHHDRNGSGENHHNNNKRNPADFFTANGVAPPPPQSNNGHNSIHGKNTHINGKTASTINGNTINGNTINGNTINGNTINGNNHHHKHNNKLIEYVAETKLPTDIGQFQLRAYRVPGAPVGQEPCVIYSRDKPPFGSASAAVPVRIHDQCLTSEVFRSQRCDCKEQLQMALHYIQKHGGCIIYLQQEGRGIGLANKIAAYALQDGGLDTVDANLHLGFPEDSREYGVVPGILQDLQIERIQLLTNNPRKVQLLQEHGVQVERTLPMVVPQINPYNRKYMETKQDRMNHKNLAALLAQDMVTPRRMTDRYINNGTEMFANAVQVSLMHEEEEVVAVVAEQDEEAGVKAQEDGWCFGRKSVQDAIAAVAHGEMVVVVDDMDRENEGDFIMAADKCTDLDMARIVRYSSGVVCVAMEGDRMDALKIPAMVSNNEDPKGTAFGVSVDGHKKHGITTGISASDRAKTVQMLADPHTVVGDLSRPGHIFPLRARSGGVLERDGHTEASVDLSRMAGLNPAGVLCEIVSEENPTEMMRLPELKRFCKRHGFVMTSIVDIAQYRREMGQ